jgi:hypothetical protein
MPFLSFQVSVVLVNHKEKKRDRKKIRRKDERCFTYPIPPCPSPLTKRRDTACGKYRAMGYHQFIRYDFYIILYSESDAIHLFLNRKQMLNSVDRSESVSNRVICCVWNLSSSSTYLKLTTFGNVCLYRNVFNTCFSFDPYILSSETLWGNVAQFYIAS